MQDIQKPEVKTMQAQPVANLQKGQYAFNVDTEIKANYIEHINDKGHYVVKSTKLPHVVAQQFNGRNFPSDDLLKYAEDQIMSVCAATKQKIHIQKSRNILLMQAYILICESKGIPYRNDSGWAYQPSAAEINFVQSKGFKPDPELLSAQKDLVLALEAANLNNEANLIKASINMKKPASNDNTNLAINTLYTVLDKYKPEKENKVIITRRNDRDK
jgi:hypothetical protein